MKQARRNKRIFKKLCKKAKELLVKVNGYFSDSFRPADGDDASVHDVYIGTWMFWTQVSWEYNEWDCEPAFDVLYDWIYWTLIEIDYSTGETTSQPIFKSPYDCIRQAEAYIKKNERTKKEMN